MVNAPVKEKAAKKKVAKKRSTKRRPTKKKPPGARTREDNGGARAGSGRKPRATTTAARKIADQLIAEGGQTPLEYMLEVLRTGPDEVRAKFAAGRIDETEYAVLLKENLDRRDWSAQQAAPYIHPRLSSIDANIGLKDQDFFADLLSKESED